MNGKIPEQNRNTRDKILFYSFVVLSIAIGLLGSFSVSAQTYCPSAELSVSDSTPCLGDHITFTISAQCDYGVHKVCLDPEGGSSQCKFCYGGTSCTKTFDVHKNSSGEYEFFGYVSGRIPDGGCCGPQISTDPLSVSIQYSECCQNECSPRGETEKRCSNNKVQERTCGDYDSDSCLEWSSWSDIEECGSSEWNNNYRCSNSILQREWIERGCSGGSCFSNSEWKDWQDCGADSWTDNYRCDQDWVQRQKNKRGCSDSSCYDYLQWEDYESCSAQGKVCQEGSCVSSPSCQDGCFTEGEKRCSDHYHYQICGNYDWDSCLEWSSPSSCSGNSYCGYGRCSNDQRPQWYCSGGNCYYNCEYSSSCGSSQDYLSCWNNDVYWFNSYGQREEKYRECGSDYCKDWGEEYCYHGDVYQERTCYRKGCKDSSCYTTSYIQDELANRCSSEETCQNGECVVLEECDEGPCCEDGHYNSPSSICDTEIQTQYGCPWGLGCRRDVGKRSRTKFRYCSGDSSECIGEWGDWGSWTSWKIADYCLANESCRVGKRNCQYTPGCASLSSVTHFTQRCFEGDLWWYDSRQNREDLYRRCSDRNECTIDRCQNGECQNEMKCDGTTCPVGSGDYCDSCLSCGDRICNCKETICSCPQDCQHPTLSVSILGKGEKQPGEWKETLSLEGGEKIDLLMIVSNGGKKQLDKVEAKVDFPSGIDYQGKARIDGQPIIEDLRMGVDIAPIPPKKIKTVKFEAEIKEDKRPDSFQPAILKGTVKTPDFSVSDSIELSLKGEGLTTAAAGWVMEGLFSGLWYLWFFLGIIGAIVLLAGRQFGHRILDKIYQKKLQKKLKEVE